MTSELTEARAKRLSQSERVEFGPLAHYFPLVTDGDLPTRTGVQVSEPGYIAPVHWHPYIEYLLILEGKAQAWLHENPDERFDLEAGDCIVLPPIKPHSFCTVGNKTMRLLGIHHSSTRIVNYLDQATDENGYPILDGDLNPQPKA